MEDAYIIRGGRKLKGEVKLSGAKNVALKTIIAALMFEGAVVLDNVPRINDVHELLHLIKLMGGEAKFIGKNKVRIDGTSLNTNKVDLLHGSKIRVSFMLFAPLLAKFGECTVPNPGGCRIGSRSIFRIIDGMRKLGVQVEYNHQTGYYEARLKGKPKGKCSFHKPTHTGTELLILISLFGTGKISVDNAATEPEIDELIKFLNESGAKIKRVGKTIVSEGGVRLKQNRPFKIISDRNEAVTFAILGVITNGDIVIKNIHEDLIKTFLDSLREAGGGVEKTGKNSFRFYKRGKIFPISIETTPHPGFMTDWQPNWAVLMTQAEGTSIIHERVFDNRFSYVRELRKLGAKISFARAEVDDPKNFYYFNDYKEGKKYQQLIKIFGPQRLHNGVLTIHDLRAGATLAIAALLAKGESVINGASILERGYEDFVEKIKNLGGDIKKI